MVMNRTEMEKKHEISGRSERPAVADIIPSFYGAVCAFPDFSCSPGLGDADLEELESRLGIRLPPGLRDFLAQCSALSMNGLSIGARELGPIRMPDSDALVIGYFYLHNPGDRLLMFPDDPAVYYLIQRNGAISLLANDIISLFENVLPKYL